MVSSGLQLQLYSNLCTTVLCVNIILYIYPHLSPNVWSIHQKDDGKQASTHKIAWWCCVLATRRDVVNVKVLGEADLHGWGLAVLQTVRFYQWIYPRHTLPNQHPAAPWNVWHGSVGIGISKRPEGGCGRRREVLHHIKSQLVSRLHACEAVGVEPLYWNWITWDKFTQFQHVLGTCLVWEKPTKQVWRKVGT